MVIKKALHIKKLKKMFSITTKVFCIDLFSLNQITTKKKSCCFIKNNRFIEISNCVQFTTMSSLFYS